MAFINPVQKKSAGFIGNANPTHHVASSHKSGLFTPASSGSVETAGPIASSGSSSLNVCA